MGSIGCGSSESETVDASDSLKQQVAKLQSQFEATQAELKTTQSSAKLLADKIKILSAERDTLKAHRDELQTKVDQAGEKMASVQTQFSELRARSVEFNNALVTLEEIISETQDDSGIAIIPRDPGLNVTGETPNAEDSVEVTPAGVYANPDPNADSNK